MESNFEKKNTNEHNLFQVLEVLSRSKDITKKIAARTEILEHADSDQEYDFRYSLWTAKEYENAKGYGMAANYYKKAYILGAESAKEGFLRCYNPYNNDPCISITGERGCGTFDLEHFESERVKQKQSFLTNLKKLNSEVEEHLVKEALLSIFMMAKSNRGLPEAKLWIAHYYDNVKGDTEKASFWYLKALNETTSAEKKILGDMLYNGQYVLKDTDRAISFYIQAALEDVDAQWALSQHYFTNNDLENGMLYLSMAAKNGYKPAIAKMTELGCLQNDESEKDRNRLGNEYEHILSFHAYDENDLGMLPFKLVQSEAFCDRAYEYCLEHYGKNNEDRLSYELCMTSFYGSICALAIWNNNHSAMDDVSPWDMLFRQINVEYCDSNAERLLGTKQGEERAEDIYDIIKSYILVAKPIILNSDFREDICKCAMEFAFRLGLHVAIEELALDSEMSSYNNGDEEHGINSDQMVNELKEMYADLTSSLHKLGKEYNALGGKIILIPELIDFGTKIVGEYLDDEFFKSEFQNDEMTYYYAIMSLCIEAGICMGNKWHTEFSALDSYSGYIIQNGPADDANKLLETFFPKSISRNQGNYFFGKLFDLWSAFCIPHMHESHAYRFVHMAMMASYQLGISMILDKYGF